MSDLQKAETKINNLAIPEQNFFEQYGNSVSNRQIVGKLLKFSKGDWLAGQDDEDIPVGTKLVANMDSLSIGWIRWDDNKPAEQIMGQVISGYRPPKRSELGFTNEDEWEEDSSGQKRDPWQFSNYVIMKVPGKPADDEDSLYTFAASSRGGLNAVGELAKAYGKMMREKPDEFPIVALGVDSYVHPNKEFGRIKVPVLAVVGWEKKVLEAAAKKPSKSAAKKR